MEPVIAQRFEEITDKKVRRRGTLRDNDYPYMLANIDRWIVGENAGLEIKTADWRMSKQWGDKDDPQDMTVPDSYYCQCMHYMAVTGADYWYIGALIGGNDFRVKRSCVTKTISSTSGSKKKNFGTMSQNRQCLR